jgi:hypothetical protein
MTQQPTLFDSAVEPTRCRHCDKVLIGKEEELSSVGPFKGVPVPICIACNNGMIERWMYSIKRPEVEP